MSRARVQYRFQSPVLTREDLLERIRTERDWSVTRGEKNTYPVTSGFLFFFANTAAS